MRPLTLVERGVEDPSVSLTRLLTGERPDLGGSTALALEDYTREIVTGGFPGMRHPDERAQRAVLDGYLARIVDTDLPELGINVRNPSTMWRWVRAFAAATATNTSYDKIRNAATGGEDDKPAKTTTMGYREALERLWILDDLEAWADAADIPVINALTSVEHPCQALADVLTIRERIGTLQGVRIGWVNTATFALGSGLAAASGALLGPVFMVAPTMGDLVGLKAFAIVILGGLGSLPGATLGGFALGFVEEYAGGYVSTEYRDAFGFLLIILALALKPQGLVPAKERIG
jgi:hypothetical protein